MKLLIISAMLLNAFPLPVDSVAPINDQQPTDAPSNSPSNDHDNQISAQNPSLDPLEDSFKQLPSDIQLKIYARHEWNSYVLNMLNDMIKDFSDRPVHRIIWSRIPWDSFTCWPKGIKITDPKSLTADELIRILKIKNKIKFTDKFRKLVLKSMKKGYITV